MRKLTSKWPMLLTCVQRRKRLKIYFSTIATQVIISIYLINIIDIKCLKGIKNQYILSQLGRQKKEKDSRAVVIGEVSVIFFAQKQLFVNIIDINITQPFIYMSQHNRNQPPKNLHAIFGRREIVQRYPPEDPYHSRNFLEEELLEPKPQDFMESLMREHEIVEEYGNYDQPPRRRSLLNYDNLMASESDNNEVPSRNSSLSSKDNNLDFHNRSFDRLPFIAKKFSEEMDIELPLPLENKRSIAEYAVPRTPIRLEPASRDKEKTQKIHKIQEVGCNCRKSKCLKMYCECFHLQIFCSQNCNCVDCGNTQPNEGHQQAVIDALTRNPKAFQQQKPAIQNGFTLGVQLAQVKKGCKCKKTKCLKKYCECYNSGSKCGMFCKCENCENGPTLNN